MSAAVKLRVRPSYRRAIELLAAGAQPGATLQLVADLFGKSPAAVAIDVDNHRARARVDAEGK